MIYFLKHDDSASQAHQRHITRLLLNLLRHLGVLAGGAASLSEVVFEASLNFLEVSASASAGGAAAESLGAPVV